MENSNQNDFIEFDDFMEGFLFLIGEEVNRDITLILLPDAIKRAIDVVKLLKEIMKENCDEDYTMTTKHIKLNPTSIYIQLEADTFAVNGKSYPCFVELVNKIDCFESIALVTGRMRYYFQLSNFYQEIEI